MTPITFDASGLIPVVAQDAASGEVLLLAFMNEEALQRTLGEGALVLWSRSRGKLWRKGEQSGHTLRLTELRVNCEGNSLLARVRVDGPGACHDGFRSCYYRRVDAGADGELSTQVVETRVFDPSAVYRAPTSSDPRSMEADQEVEEFVGEYERDARALYAAYERLRDGDEAGDSSTSRLLHQSDHTAAARYALTRAAAELAELQGVIAGTHRHHGGAGDVILEASQTGYWSMVAAIALHAAYDAWRPHEIWLDGYYNRAARVPTSDDFLDECVTLLRAAGAQCRLGGVHPWQVIATDLASMTRKHPPAS